MAESRRLGGSGARYDRLPARVLVGMKLRGCSVTRESRRSTLRGLLLSIGRAVRGVNHVGIYHERLAVSWQYDFQISQGGEISPESDDQGFAQRCPATWFGNGPDGGVEGPQPCCRIAGWPKRGACWSGTPR